MLIKVSEATNLQLDWMVTHCEGVRTYGAKDFVEQRRGVGSHWCTNWAQGGLIIEREAIGTGKWPDAIPDKAGKEWLACLGETAVRQEGPTPLIAAMRGYVMSKLGDEVDVPDALIDDCPVIGLTGDET